MMNYNLLLRLISGMILCTVFLVSIFFIRPVFYIVLYLIATLMLSEWYNMTKTSTRHLMLGLILIPSAIISLMLISNIDQNGWLLVTYFCFIWSVDCMAMVGGKLIGGIKFAPKISPNKTVSGLFTGVLSAVITVNLLMLLPQYWVPKLPALSIIKLSSYVLILGLLAQTSDLYVSVFKRKFNIKDTGTIIPGHGGMLDRFDSIILTAPIVAIYFIV
ncbi:MAG: phosphatidate cytidylyltransferase [Rickettsiaceae bacterium]